MTGNAVFRGERLNLLCKPRPARSPIVLYNFGAGAAKAAGQPASITTSAKLDLLLFPA
jgi:hypothetical protein